MPTILVFTSCWVCKSTCWGSERVRKFGTNSNIFSQKHTLAANLWVGLLEIWDKCFMLFYVDVSLSWEMSCAACRPTLRDVDYHLLLWFQQAGTKYFRRMVKPYFYSFEQATFFLSVQLFNLAVWDVFSSTGWKGHLSQLLFWVAHDIRGYPHGARNSRNSQGDGAAFTI